MKRPATPEPSPQQQDLKLCQGYPCLHPEFRFLMKGYGAQGIKIARDKIRDVWIECGRRFKLSQPDAEKLAKQWCNEIFKSLKFDDVPAMTQADRKLHHDVSWHFWYLHQR